MRCIVINLPQAKERRAAIHKEFAKLSLPYAIHPAISGTDLDADTIAEVVDHEGRHRAGLRAVDNASVACLLSHLSVFRHLVDGETTDGPDEMVAVFEDDAQLHADLPKVLSDLEQMADMFDVVKLQCRGDRPYVAVHRLEPPYSIGRIRYYDRGAFGYVITRQAAAHLLAQPPRARFEIDHLLPRFWETGLERVFYLDPPVVFHDNHMPSQIGPEKRLVKDAHQHRLRRNPVFAVRGLFAGIGGFIRRRTRFRELRKQDRHLNREGFE